MTWLVIGAGVSGLGAAKYLRKKGLTVRVSDNAKLSYDKASKFTSIGAELKDGGHSLDHLKGVTNVVTSPGLPSHHPLLLEAVAKGLPIISEVDLALKDFTGRLVAVTGTNGKSTTCAMLGHALQNAQVPVAVGGNFGDPPTAIMAEGRMTEIFVAELSSYQLETSELVAPTVAVFTSFSHDHINRHGTLSGYLAAKWRVFSKMRPENLAILPSAVYEAAAKDCLPPIPTAPENTLLFYPDAETMKRLGHPGYFIKDEVVQNHRGERLSLQEFGIEGWQNFVNAAFVVYTVAHLLKQPPSTVAPLLKGFRGLPHRCELIGHFHGYPVINDSKSTNVESTLIALTGQKKPVLLMMGGKGKSEPYAPLLTEKSKIKVVVTFGASGEEIADALTKSLTVERFSTLKDALVALPKLSEKYPGPILFSPGCASFDEFDNFEHRGRSFAASLAPHLDR